MDPITENPQPAPMNVEQPNGEHKKVGPIIATLVIVLILIIAALYLFASKVSQRAGTDQMTDPTVSPEATDTQSVQPVTNTSDDLQSIQDDLNTSTNGVDQQNF